MGIDFNNLINFGRQLAKNDGGIDNNLIEGDSQVIFNEKIKDMAKSEGVDASQIYANSSIAELMGAQLSSTQQKSFFTDEDLMNFVKENAKDITPDVAENVTDSIEVMTPEALYAFEHVVPEESQDSYAGFHVDGTADRIGKMGITANDIADIAKNAKDLDLIGLMFEIADYERNAA